MGQKHGKGGLCYFKQKHQNIKINKLGNCMGKKPKQIFVYISFIHFQYYKLTDDNCKPNVDRLKLLKMLMANLSV